MDIQINGYTCMQSQCFNILLKRIDKKNLDKNKRGENAKENQTFILKNIMVGSVKK